MVGVGGGGGGCVIEDASLMLLLTIPFMQSLAEQQCVVL